MPAGTLQLACQLELELLDFLVRLQTLANFCSEPGLPIHGNTAAFRKMKASLGCMLCLAAAAAAAPLDNDSIKTAVNAWLADAAAAEATYGHISTWDTSQVTSFNRLFYGKTGFNEDISAWDVSRVTDMDYMFALANSAFNQDLCWCVGPDVKLNCAFSAAGCTSSCLFRETGDAYRNTAGKCITSGCIFPSSCGVTQVDDLADCPTDCSKDSEAGLGSDSDGAAPGATAAAAFLAAALL